MSTLKQLMKDGDELFGSIVILGTPDWQGVDVPDDTMPGEDETPEMEGDDDIDLEGSRPDESMAANAQAALDAMRSKGIVARAISAIAMHRARQIADRDTLSPATLDKMKAYFSRVDPAIVHASAADEGKAWIEWNAWGGDAAKEWIQAK